MNQHRLIVDPQVVREDIKSTENRPTEEALSYQLFYQMSRITRDKGALKQDDRLDALTIAVGYWVDQMSLDQEERSRDREREDLLKEVENLHRAHGKGLAVFLGGMSKGPGTVSKKTWTGNDLRR